MVKRPILTIRLKILTFLSIYKCCTKVTKCLTMQVFGHLCVKLLMLLPRAQHRKSPCLNTQTPDSLERYRQVQKKIMLHSSIVLRSIIGTTDDFVHTPEEIKNQLAGSVPRGNWQVSQSKLVENVHIYGELACNATSNRRTRAEPSSAHQPHQKHHAPVHETNRRHFRDTKNAPPLT